MTERAIMNSDRWRQIQELFIAALDRSAADRSRFVREACGSDSELLHEIESLLAAHDTNGPLDDLARDFTPETQRHLAKDLTGQTVTHYEIHDTLSGGGMGVVYRARCTKLDRMVALKFLLPHLSYDQAAKKRFIVEAQAAAALEHPNICTIYEIGETRDGQLYIAMPLYEGETIKEKLDRGPLSIVDAVGLALQILNGLGRAHERGIVHRDIKPANVLLTRDGIAKIVDFGIAKLSDVTITGPGAVLGTVAYMSPEQAGGGHVDQRTDLWAVGVMLYEMLTGQIPFRGSNPLAVIHAITALDPEPIAELRPETPTGLELAVWKALAKDPGQRYQSVDSFARDLGQLIGEGSDARLDTPQLAARGMPRPRLPQLSPEGERRHATIAVSVICGYLQLVERLSPRDLEAAVSRIRNAAIEIVGRHGGMINRLEGEEIVALFGIPATHEDDLQRAVCATLELHARVRELSHGIVAEPQEPIVLQSGIDAGRVVVHAADTHSQDYRLTGTPPKVARMLMTHAGPDEVLVNRDAQRLIAPFFELEEHGPVALTDGKRSVAFRVRGESGHQSRLEAAEPATLTTYAGRDDELIVLHGRFAEAMRGHGQFVSIVGDAGLGKSRLLYEFRRSLADGSAQLRFGRCQSHGANVPYLPFVGILREALGFTPGEPQPHQIDMALSDLRAIDAGLEDFFPLYLHLLSIPNDAYPLPKHLHGEYFRLAMQEALCAVFTAKANEQPEVMLLEDWHWADEASIDILKHLAEMVSSYPFLLVVTYRPGYHVEWGDHSHHTTIQLDPLDTSSSSRIIKSVLGVEHVPDELGTLIYERTGGNPFFLEEICQALLEEETVNVENDRAVLAGSVEALELPDTIQAVIRTRIDRVDPTTREVLRVASVIGREFTRAPLQKTLDDKAALLPSLEKLTKLGLIRQIRVLPDVAYRFKHTLTQEVTYESLLQHQRKALHAKVGRAIEELYADRIDEHLELLTRHFAEANDWEKAVQYGVKAANRVARELSQFTDALHMLEDAQRWLLKLPDSETREKTLIALLLRQERMLEVLGRRRDQREVVERLLALLEPDGDEATLAEVYLRQGDLFTAVKDYEAAERALQRALDIRQRHSDTPGVRTVLRSLGLLRWHQGRNEEALPILEDALAIDRESNDLEGLVGDLSNLSMVLKELHQLERAQRCLEEALTLMAETRDPMKEVYARHILATVHRAQGDDDTAIAYLTEAAQLAEDERLVIELPYELTSLANVYWQRGEIETSLEFYEKAAATARKTRHATSLDLALRVYGEVLLALGRYTEALPNLTLAANVLGQLESYDREAETWNLVASAHEKIDSYGEAMAAWAKARALSQRTGNAMRELEALEGMARFTRRQVDEPTVALQYLREALAVAERSATASKEGELHNSIGIIEWTRGEYGEALRHYERGLEIFRSLHDSASTGLMLNSIGLTLSKLGRPDEAVQKLDEAVRWNRREEHSLLEAQGLAALGDVHTELGQADRAADCYERSLRLREQRGDRQGEGWMLYKLAQACRALGLLDRSRDYATRAWKIGDELDEAELLTACRRLSN